MAASFACKKNDERAVQLQTIYCSPTVERRIQELFMHRYCRYFHLIVKSSNNESVIEKNSIIF